MFVFFQIPGEVTRTKFDTRGDINVIKKISFNVILLNLVIPGNDTFRSD